MYTYTSNFNGKERVALMGLASFLSMLLGAVIHQIIIMTA